MATQNSTIATLLTNLTATAIGTGLTLSSKPRAAELGITEDEARALSHQIESKWAAWQSNPLEVDLSGRFDMTGLAAGFFRQWLLNGEAVATLEWQRFPGATTKTKVQLLDVAQLDRTITRYEPEDLRVLQGVVFNKVGTPCRLHAAHAASWLLDRRASRDARKSVHDMGPPVA